MRNRSLGRLGTLRGALRAVLVEPPLPAPDGEIRREPAEPDPDVVPMLTAFGVAMLQAAEPTSDVKASLERIAVAYGVEHVTVVVLPTMVMVQVAGSADLIRVENVDTNVVRLDQAAAISALARQAVAGTLEPRRAVPELGRIHRSRPRFGSVVTVLGHAVLSVGFGLTCIPPQRRFRRTRCWVWLWAFSFWSLATSRRWPVPHPSSLPSWSQS